jgi:hypothetical protein
MKHIITHMKAPWPEGAKVGDLVEFDVLPVWAVGKCKPTGDVGPERSGPPFDEALALARQDAEEAIDELKAKHAEEVASLRAEIDELKAKLSATESDDAQAAAAKHAADRQATEERAAIEARANAGKPKNGRG